jgi:hypothetical protein
VTDTSSLLLAAGDIFQIGNYAEAGLWILVAIVFGVFATRRSGTARRRCVLAVPVFLFFGLSDVVEVRTGAWWRPWWLFAWKATCVLGMIVLLAAHLRGRRTAT